MRQVDATPKMRLEEKGMKNRTLYILLAVGVVCAMIYPKVRQKAANEDYQDQLNKLPKYAADFTTPQGAILCVEDAYRKKDIEKVVTCKNFHLEAVLMAKEKDPNTINDEIVNKMANVLELAFRKEIEHSWPDFNGIEAYFEKAEPYCDNVVCVTEICKYPDGEYSRQKILVGKTDKGWRMLNPLD